MQGADSHDHAHDHDHDHDHDEPDAHDHELHDHAEHDHDDSDEVEYDEHIWTSPKNAIRLCRAVADALCAADAENADLYRANCEDYCAQLEALDAGSSAPCARAPCAICWSLPTASRFCTSVRNTTSITARRSTAARATPSRASPRSSTSSTR